MEIQYNNTVQAETLNCELKERMYDKCNEWSKKSGWMRAAGLPTGIVSGFMRVAMSIAAVAETIFKGFANLFGSMFNKKFNALTGLKQLFVNLPFKIIGAAMAPATAILGMMATTVLMVINPEKYTESRRDEWAKKHQSHVDMVNPNFKPEGALEKTVHFCFV